MQLSRRDDEKLDKRVIVEGRKDARNLKEILET